MGETTATAPRSNSATGLRVLTATGIPPGRHRRNTAGTTGGVVVETADCRRVFEDLKARGVEFEQPEPLDLPFGRIVFGRDPDGNRIQIVERPKR